MSFHTEPLPTQYMAEYDDHPTCHTWRLARDCQLDDNLQWESLAAGNLWLTTRYHYFLWKSVAEQGPCLHFFAKDKMPPHSTMDDFQQSLRYLQVSIIMFKGREEMEELVTWWTHILWKRTDSMLCLELAFPIFKGEFHKFPYNFSLSSTLGDVAGSCKHPPLFTHGNSSPEPSRRSHGWWQAAPGLDPQCRSPFL